MDSNRSCLLVASLALVASLVSAPAQGPTWANANAHPAPRSSHSVAYDEARGRLVVFGGDVTGETWERAGDVWIRRTPLHSPPARGNGGMAYDPVRGVTVLYGGFSWGGGLLSDTWEWNGEDWHAVATPQSPPPLDRLGMVYHGGTNPGIVIHGGVSYGAYSQQTWQYDGATWTLRSSNGPLHTGSNIAYAASTQRTYALNVSPIHVPSMAAWDGLSWQTVPMDLLQVGYFPPDSGMAWDPVRNQLLVAGGEGALQNKVLTPFLRRK